MAAKQGKKLLKVLIRKQMLSESQRIDYEYILTEATKQKLFGNFRQAISLYEKCIQVNSESDIAYYQIGNILLMSGNYDECCTICKESS